MLRSKSIDRLVYEYDQLLLRDLGFGDVRLWEPLITRIMDVLDLDFSLKGMVLTEASPTTPGPEIVNFLLTSWTSKQNSPGVWRNLVSLKKHEFSTPYKERISYDLEVKTKDDFLREMSGLEVYRNYSVLQEIFESDEYKKLQELHGVKVII